MPAWGCDVDSLIAVVLELGLATHPWRMIARVHRAANNPMAPKTRSIELTQVTQWEDGKAARVEDYLAAEEPLEIRAGRYSVGITRLARRGTTRNWWPASCFRKASSPGERIWWH